MQSTWWKTVLIILFLSYIFASGLPPQWRPFRNIALFPWGQWTMFVSGKPSHSELIARGQTAAGAVIDIDLYRLFPAAGHWVYEGHPLRWGLRNFAIRSPGLRNAFCAWALERAPSDGVDASEKIIAVTLSDGQWGLPPDITLPPLRTRDIASCRYVPR